MLGDRTPYAQSTICCTIRSCILTFIGCNTCQTTLEHNQSIQNTFWCRVELAVQLFELGAHHSEPSHTSAQCGVIELIVHLALGKLKLVPDMRAKLGERAFGRASFRPIVPQLDWCHQEVIRKRQPYCTATVALSRMCRQW